MQTNLYIPKKISVGFQKRADTFTGKLGFITYTDDKGLLRQANSWNGWRDHQIPIQEFDNKPQSNFVLNKDIKRSGHWSTHSKVRIYDSRDFEFEIELSNMMYILMHSDVSKRDIQEECVLAWDGKSLVLLPVNSEEYQKSTEHTRKQGVEFSLKDLVKGHSYSTKKDGDYIYLGYFDWAEKTYSSLSNNLYWTSSGKKHVFYTEKKNWNGHFHHLSSKDLCECISTDIHPQYSSLVENFLNTQNAQKLGKFSTKKGFDTVGYKRTSYDDIEVTLVNSPIVDFHIQMVEFRDDNGKPKIIRQNNQRGYYDTSHSKKREYLEEIRDNGINDKDYESLKKFFEDRGFGTPHYVAADGKKQIVTS